MANEVTLNFTFSIVDDNIKIKKSGNYKEMLSEVPPMHGVYLATLLLALDLVVQREDKMIEVIELLGSSEDVERVTGALKAIQMLIMMDGMKEEMEKAEKADQN